MANNRRAHILFEINWHYHRFIFMFVPSRFEWIDSSIQANLPIDDSTFHSNCSHSILSKNIVCRINVNTNSHNQLNLFYYSTKMVAAPKKMVCATTRKIFAHSSNSKMTALNFNFNGSRISISCEIFWWNENLLITKSSHH